MSKIFISYRRDDSDADSGRIDDRLWPKYGRANVFKDVDTIPLGLDFRRILNEEVAKCDVMLVAIGRQWVSITDVYGQRRLENPSDFVRIEVEAALARDIPVIPVLVQDAPMPQERELPTTLGSLAYRNGITVRGGRHFHADIDLLIRRLDMLFASVTTESVQIGLEKTNISADATKTAVTTDIDLIKGELPDPIASQIHGRLSAMAGGAGAMASGTAEPVNESVGGVTDATAGALNKMANYASTSASDAPSNGGLGEEASKITMKSPNMASAIIESTKEGPEQRPGSVYGEGESFLDKAKEMLEGLFGGGGSAEKTDAS